MLQPSANNNLLVSIQSNHGTNFHAWPNLGTLYKAAVHTECMTHRLAYVLSHVHLRIEVADPFGVLV